MVFYTRLSGYWHIEVANDDHAKTAYDPQVREVFLKGSTYNNDVIQNALSITAVQVHQSLEGHRWIA